jgi:hypothetical protein
MLGPIVAALLPVVSEMAFILDSARLFRQCRTANLREFLRWFFKGFHR